MALEVATQYCAKRIGTVENQALGTGRGRPTLPQGAKAQTAALEENGYTIRKANMSGTPYPLKNEDQLAVSKGHIIVTIGDGGTARMPNFNDIPVTSTANGLDPLKHDFTPLGVCQKGGRYGEDRDNAVSYNGAGHNTVAHTGTETIYAGNLVLADWPAYVKDHNGEHLPAVVIEGESEGAFLWATMPFKHHMAVANFIELGVAFKKFYTEKVAILTTYEAKIEACAPWIQKNSAPYAVSKRLGVFEHYSRYCWWILEHEYQITNDAWDLYLRGAEIQQIQTIWADTPNPKRRKAVDPSPYLPKNVRHTTGEQRKNRLMIFPFEITTEVLSVARRHCIGRALNTCAPGGSLHLDLDSYW